MIQGSPSCIVAIRCGEMDLRPDLCETGESLTINDTVGGKEEFCANQRFTSPKKGSPDLTIKFSADGSKEFSRFYKGFRCKARCSRNPEKATALVKPKELVDMSINPGCKSLIKFFLRLCCRCKLFPDVYILLNIRIYSIPEFQVMDLNCIPFQRLTPFIYNLHFMERSRETIL